jgi:methylated-DNA-[protein]-cysteine S-methyltransferase
MSTTTYRPKSANCELRYAVFQTSHGWMGCLTSTVGLLRTTLPQSSPQLAIEMLNSTIEQAAWSPDSFADIVSMFTEYFEGKRKEIPCTLDFGRATLFQRQVWEVTQSIPYGETRSYGWVAKQIGKPDAARAVGQALGKNPLPIVVPCHRVIASDGGLCGFGGGLEMKRSLLRLEGLSFRK